MVAVKGVCGVGCVCRNKLNLAVKTFEIKLGLKLVNLSFNCNGAFFAACCKRANLGFDFFCKVSFVKLSAGFFAGDYHVVTVNGKGGVHSLGVNFLGNCINNGVNGIFVNGKAHV